MINIQNTDDNECFKWSIFRYLNPSYRDLARITIADKEFSKKLDFKDIKFPVRIRDIHKLEKKSSIGISVFCHETKEEHLIYVSKKCCEKNMLIYY